MVEYEVANQEGLQQEDYMDGELTDAMDHHNDAEEAEAEEFSNDV